MYIALSVDAWSIYALVCHFDLGDGMVAETKAHDMTETRRTQFM